MAKVLLIETCEDCKELDSGWKGERSYCRELERTITETETMEGKKYPWKRTKIPDDCPLPDADERKGK